jgi:hypothetical protein
VHAISRYNKYMFGFGERNTEHGALCLIITIGSARVTATLGATETTEKEGERFVVYYAQEKQLIYQEQLDIERFNRSMYAALIELTQEVQSIGLRTVSEKYGVTPKIATIKCVFSAPWFVSQTRIVHLKRKKPFTIKEELIQSLAREEVDLFIGALKKRTSPYTLASHTGRIIDTHVIRAMVNGYQTDAPVGKSGNQLSLTIFVSIISGEVATKVTDILERVFHSHTIEFFTSTLVSYLAIEELFETTSNYLVIEVNGEVTDTSIVEDHLVMETNSFSIGTNSVARSIQARAKLTNEDIQSKLNLLLKARAERSSSAVSAFEKRVFDAITEWREALYRTLEKTSQGRPVPHTAFMLLDTRWDALYLTALKNQPFELFTFSDRTFTVLSVNSPIVRRRCHIHDTGQFYPLAILAGLIHNSLATQ